ncbi:MAG: hypothetical protein ACRELX_01055, partial [Longimicrobiales bacterium]
PMRTLLAALAAIVALPVVLLGLALALPFWLVARLTAALTGRIEPRALPWQQLIEFQSHVGWAPRARLDVHALDFHGDPFRLSTDESGWRGRNSIAESDVIVFGDSFAFGHSVDDHDFFADLPGEVRIKSIGAPGYNMVQSLHWMRRYASRLRGKVVVWLIYPANDLQDNLQPQMEGYRTPFVRATGDGGWQMVTRHVRREPWPFPSRRPGYEMFVDICRPTFLSERAFSACGFLVGRARDSCRGAGAELVVATVPELSPFSLALHARVLAAGNTATGYDPGLPDRRIGELCRGLGVRFLPLAERLRTSDYLEHDVHWNRRGHRRVAAMLRELSVRGTAHPGVHATHRDHVRVGAPYLRRLSNQRAHARAAGGGMDARPAHEP